MESTPTSQVRLEPWAEGDFWLLRRTNSPEMTEHVGGPETEEQLATRHRRYLAPKAGQMYRVTLEDTGETVGSIGFWEREWQDTTVWETGWGVLPEFQGRGLAALAARAVIAAARATRTHQYLHAFPSTDHPASNAVCRKAGFKLLGPVRFEYPKGHWDNVQRLAGGPGTGVTATTRTQSAGRVTHPPSARPRVPPPPPRPRCALCRAPSRTR